MSKRSFVKRLARVAEPAGTRLREVLARWAARGPVGASLYYLVVSRSFDREQVGVLYGRQHHLKGADAEALTYRLRRNIHRIEKGLTMEPFRDVFALDYLRETVDAYDVLVSRSGLRETPERCWAEHVLHAYFARTAAHPVIDAQRIRFFSLSPSPGSVSGADGRGHRITPDSPVCFRDFMALVKRRRSVRWFLPEPVPRAVIDAAVEAAACSPSACNRQPFRFLILDEPDDVARVAPIPMGTAGYSHNIPALAVVIGTWRAFFSERDRHVLYIDASLASMAFVLALETQGVSSCCINWPDMAAREKRMSAALKLEPDERVVMLIAFGYGNPDAAVATSPKKPVDRIRRYGLP